MILIVGLRDHTMGLVDTEEVYEVRYYQILKNDFSYILDYNKDYGFQVLTYVFTRLFGDNFQLYLFVFSMPYLIAISYFIYKYSNDLITSFILFTCLQFFEISFTLMRQVNGMAFLLLALVFFIDRKYIRFLIFVVVASLMHAVCILFLVMLLFTKPVINKKTLFLVGIIVLVIFSFPQKVLSFVFDYFITSDRWVGYESSTLTKNLTFFYINLIIWLFELLNIKNIKRFRTLMLFFVASTISLMVSPLIVEMGEASRICYLFGIFNVILLPESLTLIKKKEERDISRVIVVGLLITYYLLFLGPDVNTIPYIFFN